MFEVLPLVREGKDFFYVIYILKYLSRVFVVNFDSNISITSLKLVKYSVIQIIIGYN